MNSRLNLSTFRHLTNNISIVLILLYGSYIDNTLNIIKNPIITIQYICSSIIIQNIIVYFYKFHLRIVNDKMVTIICYII